MTSSTVDVRAERMLPILLGALVLGVAIWAESPYPAIRHMSKYNRFS